MALKRFSICWIAALSIVVFSIASLATPTASLAPPARAAIAGGAAYTGTVWQSSQVVLGEARLAANNGARQVSLVPLVRRSAARIQVVAARIAMVGAASPGVVRVTATGTPNVRAYKYLRRTTVATVSLAMNAAQAWTVRNLGPRPVSVRVVSVGFWRTKIPNPSHPPPATPVPNVSGDAVIAAAGDVACPASSDPLGSGAGNGATCRQWWVSEAILDDWSRITRVMPLGDIQYNDGAYADFLGSYDKSWGRLNAKVAPVMGNHEASGQGYFDYFNGVGVNSGVAGVRGDGWYSFDTGDTATTGWHVVALNSECVGKECGTRQLAWLQSDLASSHKGCTIAYLHKPRFSVGDHGDDSSMQPFWNLLNQYGAEVLLAGHDHDYERQVPRNTVGAADADQGVRQFVVGTGGKGLRAVTPGAFTQASSVDTVGYLEMTLRSNSYDWRFVPANSPGNGTFTDSGSTSCHS